MLEIQHEKIPLAADDSGIIYVAGTRVTLECVAELFDDGASAEEIAQEYDAIRLDDVYAVITYLLRNREAVANYLSRRAKETGVGHRDLAGDFPQSLRDKLLKARRGAGEK